ncbi:MAG: threonine synthase [Candidatus Cloacimonetes bacterium]|nr:threonine synthase [Candidatus Cloacimonadota bacterium]
MYYYQCFTCEKKWDADFIEPNFHYLCPDCKSKNQPGNPLIGVLQIFYDYDSLKTKYSKKFFKKIKSGNIFLYHELLPFQKNLNFSLFDSLTLPQNSLKKTQNISDNEIYLLDETHNPTFSYKDRASILVAAKAIEIVKTTICTASTGNAASSISGICATLGLKSKIFVPKSIPDEKLLQIKIYGADIQKVDGNYDDAFDLAIKKSKENNWYNRNTAYNPLTIEGKKSGAFDIILQMNFEVPDKVFVPVGDGVIISGLYKGFFDLHQLEIIEKIPQLIAVQAEGSSAIIDYLATKKFVLKKSKTVADSISVNAPRNLYLAADCIEKSKGFGIKVSDDEILKSEKYIGNKLGIFVEPSAAAAWTGFEKYCNSTSKKNEKIVVILTGCGLKDSKSAKKSLGL